MKKTLLSLGVAASVLLTGCASYQSSSLSALDPNYVEKYTEVEGVSIGCKAFSVNDCYTFLDRNVIAKGYQPIQLTFDNKTNHRYLFSAQSVSVPCVQPDAVAKTVHTNTVGRAVGYGVGGLFLWPLFIPAVVDGIGSSNANKELDIDYNSKARYRMVIEPQGFEKTILFIPRSEFAPIFNLTLQEQDTGQNKTIAVSVHD